MRKLMTAALTVGVLLCGRVAQANGPVVGFGPQGIHYGGGSWGPGLQFGGLRLDRNNRSHRFSPHRAGTRRNVENREEHAEPARPTTPAARPEVRPAPPVAPMAARPAPRIARDPVTDETDEERHARSAALFSRRKR